MKPIKMLAAFLALALLFPSIVTGTAAADSFGFQITATPSDTVQPGDTVEVVVSLTGYTAEAAATDAIRGVQVDITDVDSSVLNVVDNSFQSLIDDSAAASNTASYQPKKMLVRLLYAKMSGSLAAPQEGLLAVTFQVRKDLTESGSITLPVKVKITKTDRTSLTLTDSFTINYEADAGSETPITSVDVSWGGMSFTYTDGTWSPETHRYEGGGWTDDGTGSVTVANTGTADVTATFAYQTARTDITGSFIQAGAADTPVTTAAVSAGNSITVWLTLDGKPTESLANTTIGTVTVTIGGE